MRNMPTNSASSDSAVRLSAERARHLTARSLARRPRRRSRPPAGSAARMRSSSARPRRRRPATMRSTRVRRPVAPATSWAVAMSVTSRLSSARALGASAGSSTPTIAADAPAAAPGSAACRPGRSPSAARGGPRRAGPAPGGSSRASGSGAAAAAPPPSGRAGSGVSANGSIAEQVKASGRDGRRRRRRASTTGAARARRARAQARVDAASGSPTGPPTIWWVARPVTRLGGSCERAARAAVGEVDGHHDGHAEGDAEDRQAELPGVAQQVAQARAPEEWRSSPRCRSTSRPCWMREDAVGRRPRPRGCG